MLTWVLLTTMKQKNTNLCLSETEKESKTQNRSSMLAVNSKVDRTPSVASNHDTVLELQRPHSRGMDSINSFVNSTWSDDEDSLLGESPHKKNKLNLTLNGINSSVFSVSPQKLPPVNHISLPPPTNSFPSLSMSQSDIDGLFKGLALGLPAKDVMASNPLSISKCTGNDQNCSFSSTHSSRVAVPWRWMKIPLDDGRLSMYATSFSLDWFKHVILQLQLESSRENDLAVVAKELSEDQCLITMYQKIVAACHSVIYDLGLSGGDSSSSHVYKVYRGDIPWSVASEWMTEDKELLALVLKAFSRVLTIQDSPVYICSLNPEAVHAQWANLNLELLYMTNDDEERYSIQAHRTLLRNLNVQAADPPLGYPIYSSQPISIPCL
ncbi:hypothetical protein LSH36_96g03027 [Paralvinella palmiformis]|uniref:Pecanex-like protein n=1 Tax=Paralvinella palmiformis TaxID=53620 RepID=A0AAD9NBK1_9ANNE|nr:hypothetical protein LSH36_96g03027 [Paralvinella palmiformis]